MARRLSLCVFVATYALGAHALQHQSPWLRPRPAAPPASPRCGVAAPLRTAASLADTPAAAAAAATTTAELVWSPEVGVAQPDGTPLSRTWRWTPDAALGFGEAGTSFDVSYLAVGAADAPPVVLIHGFGASGFHWRANVNALAAGGYRV
jgi:hypothetical protein